MPFINLFVVNVSILHLPPQKKTTTKRQENRRFSGVFNVYKMQILTRNELRWINQNQYDQNKITYIV